MRGKSGEPEIQTVTLKEKSTFLGSFLDLYKTGLSDEKSVSTKLISANTEWVFANVSVLAEEVSKLTPKLYQRRLVGGQIELVDIDEHSILDLLDKLNETTTASDAFYVTEAHLDLTGDAFWYFDGSNIFILQPDKMTLKLGDYTDAAARLVESYVYKTVVDGESKEVIYKPNEIIHIKVPNPQNPYRGKSTVEAAAQSIDTDVFASEALKNFFNNGMIANFALTTDKSLNDDQVNRLQARLRSTRTGVRNAFKIPIFSNGLKVDQLQMSNKEVELIQIEKWFRDKIMVMFKNTPASLGIVEDVNRANAEASLGEWRRSVVKPKMARVIDALNEYLVPRYGEDLILGFEDPVPEDRKGKVSEVSELYAKSGVNKVLTLNEARDMLGLDAVSEEGADEVTQPMPPQLQQPMDNLNDEANMPKPVKNINYKAHFRRNKWHEAFAAHKQLWQKSERVAKQVIDGRKKANTPVEVKKPNQRKVLNFWKRVSEIIDEYEKVFSNKVAQFIGHVVEEASAHLDDPDARSNGELFDREARLSEAQNAFAPTLLQATALAGQEANKLLGIKTPYVPKQVKSVESQVRDQVELFAVSMLDTDKNVLAEIISNGLAEGSSIPEIRRAIQDKFADFTKSQAERITRTEVAWAANRGIVDSYKQSGVVVAKQWLTAPGACPYCAPMNGKIVGLDDSYFKQGEEHLGDAKSPLKLDYRTIEEPPLHPNCRCTTISVIEGLEPLIEAKTNESMAYLHKQRQAQVKIEELEAKIDKRTKAYRRLKTSIDQKDQTINQQHKFINELKKLADG